MAFVKKREVCGLFECENPMYDDITKLCYDHYQESLGAKKVTKDTNERTGGSTPGQYALEVQTKNGVVHVECGEIIDALNLNFNMGEAFKAIWRLEKKEGANYNLNKIKWFAEREQLRRGLITQEQFWDDK